MSNVVPLEALPNQEFSIVLDDVRYVISIREIPVNMMAITIIRDNILLISNARLIGGQNVLPFKYLEGKYGNFVFVNNGEYPWYENFGITQYLVYVPLAELVAFRA